MMVALVSCCLLQAGGPAPRQIIAYVFPQEHVLQPGEIAATKLTRINYAFANIQDGRMVEGFSHDAQNFATLVGLKAANPNLKVLVSVGGWTWSGRFSDMALTKESRRVFIDSAVAFLGRHQLDGLDIDWEYPGLPGDNNPFRPEDKGNYTLLLRELRERFRQEERTMHRHLFLSIATGAQSEVLQHTEMGKVQAYLDTVNLMAYDYYEPTSDKITGNHAPLFTDPRDPKQISADASVRDYESAGVPASKIVLGIPLYGHVWGGVGPTANGLFQTGEQVPHTYANYGQIGQMLSGGFTRHWDETAAVPYLYNPQSKMFVSYEDAESVARKCRYVVQHGLAGVMFWSYEDDPTGTLLSAMDAGVGSR